MFKSSTGADRLIENRSQRPDAVVHHSRCVLLLKSREPILTIALAYFSHIGFEQRRPGAMNEIQRHLTVIFRARLERRVRSNLATIYLHRVANCHLAASKCLYGFVARSVLADFVWQSLLRDGEDCRLKTLTDQLSANLESRKVRAGRPIADEILNGRALPKRFFCGRHGVARHMLSKSFGPRCPEIGAKTQSGSTRRLTLRQSGCADVPDRGMGLPLRRECGQCATAAERNPKVVPFLSGGYKRGIQWPKRVNENGRFSLVKAGIAQLVEQLICNQQVVGSNPTAGSPFK